MALELNAAGAAFAEKMIEDGHYRINTMWREAQPSARAQADLLARGWDEAARWYLAIDPAAPEGSPSRLQYPLGDFKSVHRSGLIAARDAAQKQGDTTIADAAEELLFLFDRISAC